MQLLDKCWLGFFRRYNEPKETQIVIEGGLMCAWTIINAAIRSSWRNYTGWACWGLARLLEHKPSSRIGERSVPPLSSEMQEQIKCQTHLSACSLKRVLMGLFWPPCWCFCFLCSGTPRPLQAALCVAWASSASGGHRIDLSKQATTSCLLSRHHFVKPHADCIGFFPPSPRQSCVFISTY